MFFLVFKATGHTILVVWGETRVQDRLRRDRNEELPFTRQNNRSRSLIPKFYQIRV